MVGCYFSPDGLGEKYSYLMRDFRGVKIPHHPPFPSVVQELLASHACHYNFFHDALLFDVLSFFVVSIFDILTKI